MFYETWKMCSIFPFEIHCGETFDQISQLVIILSLYGEVDIVDV